MPKESPTSIETLLYNASPRRGQSSAWRFVVTLLLLVFAMPLLMLAGYPIAGYLLVAAGFAVNVFDISVGLRSEFRLRRLAKAGMITSEQINSAPVSGHLKQWLLKALPGERDGAAQ